MEIRIGFSYRKMAFSKLLRWTEQRPYSHCYVKYRNHMTGQNLVLHAAAMSIHTLTEENFHKHGNITVKEYVLQVNNPQAVKDILTFVYEQSGTPYGWVQLIGMGIVKLCAFFGKKIKNPFRDGTQTMVCSEFCAHVVDKTGCVGVDVSFAEEGGPSWLDKNLDAAHVPIDH